MCFISRGRTGKWDLQFWEGEDRAGDREKRRERATHVDLEKREKEEEARNIPGSEKEERERGDRKARRSTNTKAR